MNTNIDKYTDSSSYSKNGFVVIPGLLDGSVISETRSYLASFLSKCDKSKRLVSISDILQDEHLRSLLTKIQTSKKLLDVFKNIFKNKISYVNDCYIQCNMFGLSGGAGGWHIDGGSEEGASYLHDVNYQLGRMGIYFQDNTFDYGGAIDVVPKSHLRFKHFNGNKLAQKIYRKVYGKLLLRNKSLQISVPVKAGDGVFFDCRLFHRSSPPNSVNLTEEELGCSRVEFQKLNEERSKYALYWDVGSSESTKLFLKNSCRRAISEEILNDHPLGEKFMCDYLRFSYPQDYSDDYIRSIERDNSISINSLEVDKSKMFKSLFKN